MKETWGSRNKLLQIPSFVTFIMVIKNNNEVKYLGIYQKRRAS